MASDNTIRPLTSGGDTLRSEDEGQGAKTQVFAPVFGSNPLDASRGVGNFRDEGAFALLDAMKARKRAQLDLYKEWRTSLLRSGAPPYFPSTPPPPKFTLSSALGTNLVMNFTTNYDGTTWKDDIAAQVFTQATAAKQPGIGATPGGNLVLAFNGSTSVVQQAVAFAPLAALPANTSGAQRIWGCVFNTSFSGQQYLYEPGSNDPIGIADQGGGVWRFQWSDSTDPKAVSNASVSDGLWHRVFLVGDDTTANVLLYIDGVLQTTQGNETVNINFGFDWGFSSQAFGSDLSHFWNGLAGNVFWAFSLTGFSGTDLTNIDTALNAYITG